MRIEAYNAVSQIYQAKKPGKVGKSTAAYGRDQVQISSIGKDIQTVKQAVANSSDIRKDVTEPIKAAIANGTYNVSNDDFASKLLAKTIVEFRLKTTLNYFTCGSRDNA